MVSVVSSSSEQGTHEGQGVLPMTEVYAFTETEQAWMWDLNPI